jgi:hypothetical protein
MRSTATAAFVLTLVMARAAGAGGLAEQVPPYKPMEMVFLLQNEKAKRALNIVSYPCDSALGSGDTQDLKTGQWYAVNGKDCDLPGCRCDAWVEEVPAPDQAASPGRSP